MQPSEATSAMRTAFDFWPACHCTKFCFPRTVEKRAENAWLHFTIAHKTKTSNVIACRIPYPNCKWPARSAAPRSQGTCLWSSSCRPPSNGSTPHECTSRRVYPAETSSNWDWLCTPTTIYWQAWNGAAWYALLNTKHFVRYIKSRTRQH